MRGAQSGQAIVGKAFDGGTLDETRHYYFTDSWQCLEERIDSSTDPERQHVWGIRYIDDLVLRDRDTTGNGTLDERLYFLPDANWNVTAVVDESGAVQERIEYTPYGWPQFLSPTFGTRTGSSFDVRYTYTSREWEGAVGLYYFRNRWYAPTLGVFCSRDPIGHRYFVIGLYEYVRSAPINQVDPTGKQSKPADCPPGTVFGRRPGVEPEKDGCSVPPDVLRITGWRDANCPRGGARFEEVCDRHDLCYAECGISKSLCDANFGHELAEQCRAAAINAQLQCPGFTLNGCLRIARLYHFGVNIGGTPAFEATQESNCTCLVDCRFIV